MKRAILISLCLVLVMSTVTLSGNNDGVAKGIVHVRTHSAKAGCTYGTFTTCADIVTTVAGADVDAFPVFYGLNEFLGCEYSIVWPAWSYSAAFSNCADFVIGSIAWSGDGASHTWLDCDYSGFCVPSFLWIYADGPGTICISGHPQHGTAFVLDCAEGTDTLIGWGCAGVNGATGHDPCGELPPPATTPTTWSQIKSLFQ